VLSSSESGMEDCFCSLAYMLHHLPFTIYHLPFTIYHLRLFGILFVNLYYNTKHNKPQFYNAF
jgi:hypothetical protein